MTKLGLFAILFLVVVGLNACSSTGREIYADNTNCQFLSHRVQPTWVEGDNHLAGYYTGVGTSEAIESSDLAISRAQQSAIAELSGNIQTVVKQSLIVDITESGQDLSSQDVDSFTRSVTENSLKNVVRDEMWLDYETCRLWMRLKLSEQNVNDLQAQKDAQLKLERATSLFTQAENEDAELNERSGWIDQAVNLFKLIEFKYLKFEDRSLHLTRAEDLQRQIKSQVGSQNFLVITLSDDDLPESIHKEIAYRLSTGISGRRHLYPAPCSNASNCLRIARQKHAKTLVLVDIELDINSGTMGSYIGDMSLSSIVFDVESERQINQVQNQIGQALSFSRSKMKWGQAVTRIFENNELLADQVQTARRCSIEVC
jgi:hypothetical protein